MEAAVSAFQQDGVEIHSCSSVQCLELVYDALRAMVAVGAIVDAARDEVYKLGEAHGLKESEIRVLHILALSTK